MDRRRLLLAVASLAALVAACSHASAATCITSVDAGVVNVVSGIGTQTGGALTAATPGFGTALTGATIATTSAPVLTGASLATTTAPGAAITNPTTVNVLGTKPGGVFFQNGGSDVVMATNPPGIQNVAAIGGTVSSVPVVTAATLSTTAGNAVTAVSATTTSAPVLTGLSIQSGSFVTGVTPTTTPVANLAAVGNGVASATASALACGNAASASGEQAAAFGPGSNASGTGALAMGAGAVAAAPGAVAIGAGSVAREPNTVSVGAPGAERRITNVAAGIAPTDAVNVSQLTSLGTNLQNQINFLQNQITDNQQEARAGTALALAAAGLKFNGTPGKVSVSSGFGYNKGFTALAVGIGYAPSRALILNAGVSAVPSRGDVGVFGAASWTLN